MRLLSVITFSSIVALATVSSAATAPSAASIRGGGYTVYSGDTKEGRGSYKNCKAHYATNPQYNNFVQTVQALKKEIAGLKSQIKARTKSNPCPHQEHMIDIGEAIIAGLQAQREKLQTIAAKLAG